MYYDVAAYGRDGNLSVIGEAKVRLATDAKWAAEVRRNILEHESQVRARFFMVVVPDRLYLWHGDASPEATPLEIDAQETFAPYFKLLGISPAEIQPVTFENVVSWWLSDLTHADPTKVDPRLRQSGMLEAIVGGRISRELAA